MTAEKNKFEQALKDADKISLQLKLQVAARSYPNLITDIFQGCPIAIVIFSFDGNFILSNQVFERIIGYEPEEIEGKLIISFVHPEDVQVTLGAIGYALRNEEPRYFINRYKKKGGGWQWLLWYPQPPANDDVYGIAYAAPIKSVPANLQAGFIEREDLFRLEC